MIGAIDSGTKDGTGGAPDVLAGWSSQANRIGLDTSQLTSLKKHLSWAQDQLPMLRRRHSLAVDSQREEEDYTGGGDGMVSGGAGSLGNFPTQAAAQKAAQKDEKDFKDGKISLQDYMKLLSANESDPDYATTAVNALNSDHRLDELRMDSGAYDPSNQDAGSYVLATLLSTAMHNGVQVKDGFGNDDLSLLAPLAQYGNFPKSVLVNLGMQATGPGGGNAMYGNDVWNAMANNPAASTQFLHDFKGRLGDWIKHGSDHHGGMAPDQAAAFAKVIKAGTIPGMGNDPNMAADNATALIKAYSGSDHTYGPIQNAFGSIISNYWSDMQASVTDPAPPGDLGAGHVSVSSAQWQGFIHEAMQDGTTAADLLSTSRQEATTLAQENPDNPEALHAAGLLNGVFGAEAMKVYKEKGDAAKKWQTTVTNEINATITTGLVVAFDPPMGAADIASKLARPVTRSVATEAMKLFMQDKVSVDGGGSPEPPKLVTWQDDWTLAASIAYSKNHDLGHPQQYAEMYSDGKPFLNSGGQLVDNASPQQQAAYNAWLKDQDVAQATDGRFLDLDHGRISGRVDGE
ncbi:hypothetical protein BIV57_07875 [Mangrovactinospora gilvigrisea]|uniref:Uncharacterized protein n=2 Tax=Mangrovactinospora gilvigrisea TaxID=1428644 RepID=A0A1J7C911_9ACTN|nr:hypothetical protein BIV57_07875 [Mangrovactinospora gilvigrisea]